MKTLWGFILVAGLFSCQGEAVQEVDEKKDDGKLNDEAVALPSEEKTDETKESKDISFEDEVDFVNYCVTQLQEGNADALHPFTNGKILFSPYAYIHESSARRVALDEIADPTNELHYWGIYDGRGDSILLTTADYFDEFVFNFNINDQKVKVETYKDKPKAYGTEQQNIHKVYPESVFVEFYQPPSEEGYMDWNVLIFVVKKKGDQYLLKAIVHSQWTV